MAQWLRALALAGDPGWTQLPHGGSQLSSQVQAIRCPLPTSAGIRHDMVHMYVQAKHSNTENKSF